MPKEILLQRLKNASVYGGVKASDGSGCCQPMKGIVALMGPNGAGKSTVLKAIFDWRRLFRLRLWHEKL